MKNNRPLILISNDDGYSSKGLASLIDMIRDFADILVCAPDSARSGYSCAFSATLPLVLEKQHEEEGLQVWSCNGTPVDCVKMALDNILTRRPDMIIGGINHGDNASVNVHYSGTMGVTFEGCMKYIPSVAFSLCDHNPDADFSLMTEWLKGRGETRPFAVLIRVVMTITGWWAVTPMTSRRRRTPTTGRYSMAMWQ